MAEPPRRFGLPQLLKRYQGKVDEKLNRNEARLADIERKVGVPCGCCGTLDETLKASGLYGPPPMQMSAAAVVADQCQHSMAAQQLRVSGRALRRGNAPGLSSLGSCAGGVFVLRGGGRIDRLANFWRACRPSGMVALKSVVLSRGSPRWGGAGLAQWLLSGWSTVVLFWGGFPFPSRPRRAR